MLVPHATKHHKRADKRLSPIQKVSVFAASAVLEIADELILAQNENISPKLRKIMGHTVDSAEHTERLSIVLNQNMRT